MKKIEIEGSGVESSQIILGCMRIDSLTINDTETLLKTAIDEGINFFDHADIYGGGECEKIFARALPMNQDTREKILLQSKCGIRDGMYDFSKDHILKAVDGILTRLDTDYLDFLLLHRPDTLMEPDEVAAAFNQLTSSGKVRHFGVSNQNPNQIELLQNYLKQPLIINQLQFGIMHAGLIDSGFNVNMRNEAAVSRDGGALEYCRLNRITIQAWSPFQYGFFEGVFLDNDKFPELNQLLEEIAAAHKSTPTAVATAWILRHPAQIQVIAGTTKSARLQDICSATSFDLSREEWYQIYRATGSSLP